MFGMIPRSMVTPGFGSLASEMERLFNLTGGPAGGEPRAGLWPGMNVWRSTDELVVETEIPGFRREDIEVLATEDTLTVRGRREPTAPEGAAALRIERSIDRFERSVRLPVVVDPNGVSASVTDGVLRIALPIGEAARPRRVEVGAGDRGTSRELGVGSGSGAVSGAGGGARGETVTRPVEAEHSGTPS